MFRECALNDHRPTPYKFKINIIIQYKDFNKLNVILAVRTVERLLGMFRVDKIMKNSIAINEVYIHNNDYNESAILKSFNKPCSHSAHNSRSVVPNLFNITLQTTTYQRNWS